MAPGILRDRLTWTAYVLLAWFAYLQAAPGLVVTHLRSELELSYSTGGLYVAAFAGGSTVAGLVSTRLEAWLGRRTVLWTAPVVMAAGAVGLTAGRTAATTLGSVLVMGLGGGLLLATIQALLADHHGDRRTVALAEANVAASLGYLALVGLLSVAAWLGSDWRTAVLVALVVPLLVWVPSRRVPVETATAAEVPATERRLPRAFWLAAAILVCTTAVEWSVTAWGATFTEETAGVSADTAVALMAGYFGGFVAGRVIGARLAARAGPDLLLGWAIGAGVVGFAVLWTASAPVWATCGLALLGVGIGNLFPMAVSLAVAVAPGRATQASGRAVAASARAILFAPVTVGALADATSLRTALLVVPVLLVLAAAGLLALRAAGGAAPGSSP
jgi:fucose permease